MISHKLKLSLSSNVRKLSSLANAFNTNDYIDTNKKYANEKISGLFGIDDLKIDGGIDALKYKAESDCHFLLKEALSSIRQRKIVEVLDDISDSICQVADLSECMRLLHPDVNSRNRFTRISQSMSRIVEIFNTNQQLFAVIDKVVQSDRDGVQSLDKIDKAVLNLLHRDFQASGIHLNDTERKKFLEATQLSLEIGSDFHTNTELPVKINASILSKEMLSKLNLAPNQTIEISHPYLWNHDSDVRELGYRGYYSNNPDQEERLRCLLEFRYNVAKYSGYDSFSERANMSMICETPEKVQHFITNLSEKLLPTAEKDRIKMLNCKYNQNIDSTNLYGIGSQLLPWDLEYFTYRLRQESMPGGYERYQPYFSLGACIEGISQLIDAHFSVGMELQEAIPGELWHPDVFKLVLYQKHNANISSSNNKTGILGTVYCDLFARNGKLSNDCHFTVRAGRSLNDGKDYQTPIVVLQANLGRNRDRTGPVFLTPPQVESLFHEWGHALHSLLTCTRYQHAAGTRCSTDLAEAPSTLMELFSMDRRVVKEYARNGSQQMSEDMLLGLEKQKGLGVSINQQHTLVLSMFDQLIHGKDLPISSGKSSKVFNNLFCNNNSNCNLLGSRVFDLPTNADELYYGQRFSHLLNYGARFYSYSLSNCIAGYIWRSGFDKDPWSSSLGHRYRQNILQHGGQYKPLEMLSEFSGKANVTVDDLVDDYVENIEAAYESV